MLELATGVIRRLPGVGDGDETVGQPVFTPCGDSVVYTSWPTSPKRLGMIYCYQRPCSLKLTRYWPGGDTPDGLVQPTLTLTSHLKLARYAVFAPSSDALSDKLVFLGSEKGFDMHNNSAQLFVFDFGKYRQDALLRAVDLAGGAGRSDEDVSEYCRTIIDEVNGAGMNELIPSADVANINGYTFPGLFAGGLKSNSFICEDVIMVESQWRSYAVVLCVNLTSGDIRALTFDDKSSSFLISQPFKTDRVNSEKSPLTAEQLAIPPEISHSWLSVCPFSMTLIDCFISTNLARAVLAVSSPTQPPRLAVFTQEDYINGTADAMSEPAQIATVMSAELGTIAVCRTGVVSQPPKEAGLMQSYILHTHLVHPSYTTTLESILLLPPPSASPAPLLVSPHGGPHSAFSTTYVAQHNYLCASGGFAILMVNYRGSTVCKLLMTFLV